MPWLLFTDLGILIVLLLQFRVATCKHLPKGQIFDFKTNKSIFVNKKVYHDYTDYWEWVCERNWETELETTKSLEK